jgi:hypothetical protein
MMSPTWNRSTNRISDSWGFAPQGRMTRQTPVRAELHPIQSFPHRSSPIVLVLVLVLVLDFLPSPAKQSLSRPRSPHQTPPRTLSASSSPVPGRATRGCLSRSVRRNPRSAQTSASGWGDTRRTSGTALRWEAAKERLLRVGRTFR